MQVSVPPLSKVLVMEEETNLSIEAELQIEHSQRRVSKSTW